MAIKNLKVNFLQSGADQVKLSIDSVSAKADQFGKKDVKARVGVDDATVSPKLTAIQAKLDALTKRRNELLLNANTAKAQYDLARVGVTMDKLSKMTANPNISVKGVDAAAIKLLGLEATMDRIQDKSKTDGAEAGDNFSSGFGEHILSSVITGAVSLGLAGVPALAGAAGALAGVAMGAALAIAGSKTLQAQGKSLAQAALLAGEAAAAPLQGPISQAMTQIQQNLPSLAAEFHSVFLASAADVQPLTTGLLALVKNALPGLTDLIRGSGPAVQAFSNSLGDLGTYLSKTFDDLEKGSSGAAPVLRALLDDIGQLTDDVAKFATALANGAGGPLVMWLNTATGVVNVVANLTEKFPQLTTVALDFLAVWKGSQAVSGFGNLLDTFSGKVTGLGSKLTTAAEDGEGALAGLAGKGGSLLAGLGEEIGGVAGLLTGPLGLAITAAAVVGLPLLSKAFHSSEGAANQLSDAINATSKSTADFATKNSQYAAEISSAYAGIKSASGALVLAQAQVAAAQAKSNGSYHDAEQALADASGGYAKYVKDLQAATSAQDALDKQMAAGSPGVTAFGTVLAGVTQKVNSDLSAVDAVNSAWEKFFSLMGDSQSALTGLGSDITAATSAIKKYGAGTLEAHTAIGTVINDNQTLISSLKEQVTAAGNSKSAIDLMKSSFLDAASKELAVAGSSKTLQGALVEQAQEAGINVTSWSQLKGMLEKTKGGMDAASKSADTLSQEAENNTNKTALMQQAQSKLTSVLGAAQKQGILTADQVGALSAAVIHNTGQVDVSNAAFDVFAAKMGVSKSQADKLWSSLKQVAGNYLANVKVSVAGGGTVKVQGDVSVDTGTGIATSLNTGEQTFNGYSYASGGRITMGTTPTADDVHVRVSRGETVVSAAHSKKLSPVFRAVGVPGYANGGLIGASDSGNSYPSSVASLLGNYQEPKFADTVGSNISKQTVTALASALKTGIKDAIAAIQELGSGPLGVGVSGGEMANGRQLYDYLLSNVFGGAKIAAAGAVASIWGESTWNPFAQGTGGRGLIGWTPPGSISDAAFNGGMATQLPAIVRFIGTSGDWGVINEMRGASTILDAANLWGKGVERYGINDVHSTGLALAAEIMGSSTVSVNKKTGIGTSQVTGEQTFNGYSYDNGGLIPEPVQGYGLRTGKDYMFHANEWVTPSGHHISNGSGGGDVYNIAVQGDTDPDGAALRIIQKVRDYKRHHGGQDTGIG